MKRAEIKKQRFTEASKKETKKSPRKKQPIIPTPFPRNPSKQKKNIKLRVQKDIYGVMWAEFLCHQRNIYYWGNGYIVKWKLPLGWNPPLNSIYS